jgi:hypothetical protein
MTATEALRPLLHEADRDDEVLAVLLTGSQTTTAARDSEDCDVVVVVTEERLHRLRDAVERRGQLSLVYLSPQILADMAAVEGWWTYGLASAAVLLDKTGEVTTLIGRLGRLPAAEAKRIVLESYDEYLRFFVRAIRADAREDVIGCRLHTAEALIRLARLLFALERRPAPYHDRLQGELSTLELGDWPPGYLNDAFARIAASGDRELHGELERRLEALMETQGIFNHREWGTKLRRVDGR